MEPYTYALLVVSWNLLHCKVTLSGPHRCHPLLNTSLKDGFTICPYLGRNAIEFLNSLCTVALTKATIELYLLPYALIT